MIFWEMSALDLQPDSWKFETWEFNSHNGAGIGWLSGWVSQESCQQIDYHLVMTNIAMEKRHF